MSEILHCMTYSEKYKKPSFWLSKKFREITLDKFFILQSYNRIVRSTRFRIFTVRLVCLLDEPQKKKHCKILTFQIHSAVSAASALPGASSASVYIESKLAPLYTPRPQPNAIARAVTSYVCTPITTYYTLYSSSSSNHRLLGFLLCDAKLVRAAPVWITLCVYMRASSGTSARPSKRVL